MERVKWEGVERLRELVQDSTSLYRNSPNYSLLRLLDQTAGLERFETKKTRRGNRITNQSYQNPSFKPSSLVVLPWVHSIVPARSNDHKVIHEPSSWPSLHPSSIQTKRIRTLYIIQSLDLYPRKFYIPRASSN